MVFQITSYFSFIFLLTEGLLTSVLSTTALTSLEIHKSDERMVLAKRNEEQLLIIKEANSLTPVFFRLYSNKDISEINNQIGHNSDFFFFPTDEFDANIYQENDEVKFAKKTFGDFDIYYNQEKMPIFLKYLKLETSKLIIKKNNSIYVLLMTFKYNEIIFAGNLSEVKLKNSIKSLDIIKYDGEIIEINIYHQEKMNISKNGEQIEISSDKKKLFSLSVSLISVETEHALNFKIEGGLQSIDSMLNSELNDVTISFDYFFMLNNNYYPKITKIEAESSKTLNVYLFIPYFEKIEETRFKLNLIKSKKEQNVSQKFYGINSLESTITIKLEIAQNELSFIFALENEEKITNTPFHDLIRCEDAQKLIKKWLRENILKKLTENKVENTRRLNTQSNRLDEKFGQISTFLNEEDWLKRLSEKSKKPNARKTSDEEFESKFRNVKRLLAECVKEKNKVYEKESEALFTYFEQFICLGLKTPELFSQDNGLRLSKKINKLQEIFVAYLKKVENYRCLISNMFENFNKVGFSYSEKKLFDRPMGIIKEDIKKLPKEDIKELIKTFFKEDTKELIKELPKDDIKELLRKNLSEIENKVDDPLPNNKRWVFCGLGVYICLLIASSVSLIYYCFRR